MRFSEDSLKLRIWKAGKLVDISIRKDTIIGQKIFYIHSNSSRKRNPDKHKIIYYKYNIENERINANEQLIDTIFQHFLGEKDISMDSFSMNNSSKVEYDSISFYKAEEKKGDIVNAIEYADREHYVWTGWISNSRLGEILERIMDDLEMNDFDKLNNSNLPNGAWYSYGGTVAYYKMTFLQNLLYKISFWKKF